MKQAGTKRKIREAADAARLHSEQQNGSVHGATKSKALLREKKQRLVKSHRQHMRMQTKLMQLQRGGVLERRRHPGFICESSPKEKPLTSTQHKCGAPMRDADH